MRRLLNTLYITTEDIYLNLDGENVVAQRDHTVIGRFPLHTLEGIITFSYSGATPALMGACAERDIGLIFMSPRGKFLARSLGKSQGNILLRKEQYRISDDLEKSLFYAKSMIIGKVYNSRWSLERTCRDHQYRIDIEKVKAVSLQLKEGISNIQKCESLDSLRGLEGELASRYFSVFNELILNQKEDFSFQTRTKRPPLDCVNALLSFAYTIIAGDCANALESVGLDAYAGFMHRDRPGRKSLALDLMEELRAIMADRFVLTLINNKAIQAEHFEKQKDSAVYLNENGRKLFLSSWQMHKKEQITHPFLKEKIEWGLVPYVQALLLARTIRQDLDAYPPFLWK